MHGKTLEISPWHTWCDAVMTVATRAKAALPQGGKRLDNAIYIALAGDVRLLEDGSALVASQSNGHTAYRVVADRCNCPDAAKAPSAMCKHRLAVAIATRAYTDATQRVRPPHHYTNGHQPLCHPSDVAYTTTTSVIKDGYEVCVTLQKPGSVSAAFYDELAALPAWLRTHGYVPCSPTTDRLTPWRARLTRPVRRVLLVSIGLAALLLLCLPFPHTGNLLLALLTLVVLTREALAV